MSELRRNLQINGQTYQLAVSQYDTRSPSATTPGKPGVLYLNTSNGNLYKCTAADPASNTYTWVAMIGAGGLFASTTKGQGAEEISVMALRINKPNAGYVLSIGDKLITADNYLYEITALPDNMTTGGYTAKLIRNLGSGSSPNWSGIHIGPEPPEDTNMLWVDTDDNSVDDAIAALPQNAGVYYKVSGTSEMMSSFDSNAVGELQEG